MLNKMKLLTPEGEKRLLYLGYFKPIGQERGINILNYP